MKQTYYKIVAKYRGKLFSLNGWKAEMDTIIRKEARGKHFSTVEYVKGKWVGKPRVGNNLYKRRLFVFNHITTACELYVGMAQAAIYECKVKNPTPLVGGTVLVDAVKLGKKVR